MAATDGTGRGLLEFLDWAGSRGEINPGTAKAFATTARQVLLIEGDYENRPLSELDLESVLSRFETLNRTQYSVSSMSTYQSRFRSACAMYLAWLDKRSDWKTLGPSAKRKSPRKDSESKRNLPKNESNHSQGEPDPGPPAPIGPVVPSERMIPYEFPLRENLRVRLILPEDLTLADANRISSFVRSLAFGEDRSPENI